MTVDTNSCNLKNETANGLRELAHALHDSRSYLDEAAEKIDDVSVSIEFRKIASERALIETKLKEALSINSEEAEIEGTWLGSLRETWLKCRSALNGGDATVVLIEAERAEDAIVAKYKEVLPEVAGNPMNDQLLADYEVVKAGHDRVRALRDQNS